MTLVLYRRRAHEKVEVSAASRRAFDKAVRRKPLADAADAGLWKLNGAEDGIGECRGGGRGRRGESLGVESGQKRKAVVAGEGKQREEGMDLSRRHTRTGAAKQASFSGWGRRFHAATVTRSGEERSWIWAAVSLSTTIIGAPQLGQSQRGLDSRGVDVSGSVWGGTAPSAAQHSGRRVERRRLARKPKWRMRTKPLGSRCNRKRRRNSSSDTVISFCSWL